MAAVTRSSHTSHGVEAPPEAPLPPPSAAAAGGPSHGLIHTGRNPSGSVNWLLRNPATTRSKSIALHLHSTAPQRSGHGRSVVWAAP